MNVDFTVSSSPAPAPPPPLYIYIFYYLYLAVHNHFKHSNTLLCSKFAFRFFVLFCLFFKPFSKNTRIVFKIFPGFLETFVNELRVSQFIEKGFNHFPNELRLERFQEALQSQFIQKGFKKTTLWTQWDVIFVFIYSRSQSFSKELTFWKHFDWLIEFSRNSRVD